MHFGGIMLVVGCHDLPYSNGWFMISYVSIQSFRAYFYYAPNFVASIYWVLAKLFHIFAPYLNIDIKWQLPDSKEKAKKIG